MTDARSPRRRPEDRSAWRRLSSAVALFGLCIVCGCSSSDLGSEVSGKVTLDGKAVGPGTIVFAQPGSGANPSIGTIQPDGSYFMKTTNAVGLPPGQYKVAVTVFEPVAGAPGERSMAPPVYVTPEKYATHETSGLEYDVKPGSNTIDVPLTAK